MEEQEYMLDAEPLQKRHSAREKRTVEIDDLGYSNKEQLKKAGKGASEAYKKCEQILAQLRKHPCAGQFLYPVMFPGYAEAVKEPMDLSTVERKLKAGIYTSTNNFALDVRKIWSNAWSFNQPGSDIYIMTTQISDYFENKIKEVEDVAFVPNGNNELQELKKKVNKVSGALRKIAGNAPAPLLQRAASSGNGSKKPLERPMNAHEKAQLGQNIRKLPQDKVLEMLQLLRDVVDLSKATEGVELDLEKLTTRKCRELEQYVKKALGGSKKKATASKKKKLDMDMPMPMPAAQTDPEPIPEEVLNFSANSRSNRRWLILRRRRLWLERHRLSRHSQDLKKD